MSRSKHAAAVLAVAAASIATMAFPAIASADPAICHNGVLSDDAGQGCADGLFASTGGAAESAICHNGILSDDAGQGCADGLYARAYGSTTRSTAAPAPTPTQFSGGGVAPPSSIAQCESGGNPHAVSGNGMYRGKWQFSYSTWRSVGGSGDPAAASEGEQDRRAAILYSRTGASSWPVCGR
jgi:hypothetical protein